MGRGMQEKCRQEGSVGKRKVGVAREEVKEERAQREWWCGKKEAVEASGLWIGECRLEGRIEEGM